MNKKIAKPFLKWAGGKTQLINDIAKSLPAELIDNEFTYIEPFVGSGAVLFWMLNKFENLKKVIINDINQDLINVYLTIAENPNELIVSLESLQNQYHSLGDDDNAKKQFYYQKREIMIKLYKQHYSYF
jgi:DNA adenine methylase